MNEVGKGQTWGCAARIDGSDPGMGLDVETLAVANAAEPATGGPIADCCCCEPSDGCAVGPAC